MKCRIGKQDAVSAGTVIRIRNVYTAVSDEVLVNTFGFGSVRLERFHAGLRGIAERYDACGVKDRREKLDKLNGELRRHGYGFDVPLGSGSGIEHRREHDIFCLYIFHTLHEVLGFGHERMHRFLNALNERTGYYNVAFKYSGINILDVIGSRVSGAVRGYSMMDWGNGKA